MTRDSEIYGTRSTMSSYIRAKKERSKEVFYKKYLKKEWLKITKFSKKIFI